MKFPVALVAFCLGSLVQGNPLSYLDVGNTSVKLASDPTNPDHFMVTVERVDDLMNEDGETMAERILSVALNFDVQDNMLMLNGDEISPLGQDPKVTTVKATFVRADVEDPEALRQYFSEGLVNIKVSSKVENFLIVGGEDENGLPQFGRHVTISERILEIDGNKVRQSDISEQVLDVYNNGTIVRSVTEPMLEQQITAEVAEDTNSQSAMGLNGGDFLDSWDNEFDADTQAALFGVALGLLFTSLLLVPFLLIRRRRQTQAFWAARYAPLATASAMDSPPSYDAKEAALFSEVTKPVSAVTTEQIMQEEVDAEGKITVMEALHSEEDRA